ncbi:MAG TPA: DUF3365 domain-containing protein [Nitrospina sp.]|nr:DUF3365 domain-containing protein [Nitrospina sp.]
MVRQMSLNALDENRLPCIRPFIGQTRLGRRNFFQAIYPDFAVTQGCVSCHNDHPKSSKNDFEINDVMGGIVVTLSAR